MPSPVAPFQGFKEEEKQNESRWSMLIQGVALASYVPAFQAERPRAGGAANNLTADTDDDTSAGGGGQEKSERTATSRRLQAARLSWDTLSISSPCAAGRNGRSPRSFHLTRTSGQAWRNGRMGYLDYCTGPRIRVNGKLIYYRGTQYHVPHRPQGEGL